MGYPARETLRKRDALVGATCLHYAAEHGRTECAKVGAQIWILQHLCLTLTSVSRLFTLHAVVA